MYTVVIKKKALKKLHVMPVRAQQKLTMLLEDLRDKGPIRSGWPNYSKLGDNLYHCHLSRKWVACWICEPESIRIEVYYAGSRENAPY
jgi:hypothetical protein